MTTIRPRMEIPMKTKQEMLKALAVLTDEDKPYSERLAAYEFLLEDCEDVVDDMLEKFYASEGETGKMLIEILAGYKGNPAVYMGLVSYLYKGEDVALFARLLGGYGDERAIDVLKSFVEEYDVDYNEYMEIRNAVEELGGDFDDSRDFTDDPFYRFIKGLDEPEEESRRSPFEDILNPDEEEEEECGCHHDHDEDCGCDDGDCDCHHDHDHNHDRG